LNTPALNDWAPGNGNSVWTGKTDCEVKLDLLIVDYKEARKSGKAEAPAEFAEKGLVCFIQSREGPIG
jgi:hypothetical protein